jgi:membrane protein DedA with SNARE-associated domain
MPAVRFGIYTTIGCIPWTVGLAYAGYALGSNWQSVDKAFHGPTYIIAGIIVVLLVLAVVLHLRRRRRTGAHAAGHQPDRARERESR